MEIQVPRTWAQRLRDSRGGGKNKSYAHAVPGSGLPRSPGEPVERHPGEKDGHAPPGIVRPVPENHREGKTDHDQVKKGRPRVTPCAAGALELGFAAAEVDHPPDGEEEDNFE